MIDTDGESYIYVAVDDCLHCDAQQNLTDVELCANKLFPVFNFGLFTYEPGKGIRRYMTTGLTPGLQDTRALEVANRLLWSFGLNDQVFFNGESLDAPFDCDTSSLCDVVEFQDEVYVAAGIQGIYRVGGSKLVSIDIGAFR